MSPPSAAAPSARPGLARTGVSAYRQKHPPPKPVKASVFTHEPLSSIFIAWRGLTSFLLVPYWIVYYALLPRPRPSWSLKQAVQVAWMRHVTVIPEKTNLAFGTRDPETEPVASSLKETSFVWAPPLREQDRTGILVDSEVAFQGRVGTFVWPKARALERDEGGLIGLCFHGGALVHMSAGEKSGPAAIPRRLIKDRAFQQIFSVEYRLIKHTAFPGYLQDAASVYSYLVRDLAIPAKRIVLIGDSAGGNVALGLCRWVRDSSELEMPGGMLLFSPWSDPSHSFPYEPSSHIPRPNHAHDYLLDDPAPRSLLVTTLLGHHPQSLVHSPYISPACWQLSGQSGIYDNFPPTFVHYGGAERLEFEIESLIDGLTLDDVPLTVMRTPDAVHDVLILVVWDERERDGIWREVGDWLRALREGKPKMGNVSIGPSSGKSLDSAEQV